MSSILILFFARRRAAVCLFTGILLLAFSRFTIGQNSQANMCHMDSSGFCIAGDVSIPPSSLPISSTNSAVTSVVLAQEKPVVTAQSPVSPKLDVEFHNGLLQIAAENVSLKETLKAVSTSMAAEVQFPVGALDDIVFVHLGPGAPQEIVAQLLKGSPLNYVMLSSNSEPGGMTRLILTRTTPDSNSTSSAALTSPNEASAPVELYGTFAVDADASGPTSPQPDTQSATPLPSWAHHDGAVLSGEQLDQMQKVQLQQEQQQFAQQLQQERQRQQEQAAQQ